MRNTLKIFLSLVGLPFVLAACGDDTNNNNPTGGGNTDLTLAELGEKVRGIFCTGAVECHRAETEAECLASTEIQLDVIAAAVEAGTVKYHPETSDACLAALAGNFACEFSKLTPDSAAPPECLSIFEGTVADGGACSIDEACVSGNCEAVDPMCSMQCCDSKCAPKATPATKAKIGESCAAPGVSCEAGAYCQYDMMGMPTTCAAQVAEGQACTDFSGCKAPSVCDLDFMTGMGTCKVPAAHGAACNPQGILACDRFDDYCDATTKVCTTQKLPGESCLDADCVDYADCDAMDKCVKQPVAGDACDAMNGPNCLNDLDCTNAKCALTPAPVCP